MTEQQDTDLETTQSIDDQEAGDETQEVPEEPSQLSASVISVDDADHHLNALENLIEHYAEHIDSDDEVKSLEVCMEQVHQLKEFVEHTCNERSQLAKRVDVLEQDKAFYKAKAAQQGEAAVNADRANLRRVMANVVQMLRSVKVAPAAAINSRRGAIGKFNRGQSVTPEDPNLTAIQTIQRAKDLLETAMTGNRRRKYVNSADPRKVRLKEKDLLSPEQNASE